MTPLVVRITDVIKLVALCRSTIYLLEKKGKFPKKRQLSEGRVGWLYQEIVEWVQAREVAE